MRLFDKLLKRNQEKVEDVKVEQPKTETVKAKPTIRERYPDGLPQYVLEWIDYARFGGLLKQAKLLPPSYDKRPAKIEIKRVGDIPRVKLTFKSKTSQSFQTIAIYRYDVSVAKQGSHLYTPNDMMQEYWEAFCEYDMNKWERGYRVEIMNKDLFLKR